MSFCWQVFFLQDLLVRCSMMVFFSSTRPKSTQNIIKIDYPSAWSNIIRRSNFASNASKQERGLSADWLQVSVVYTWVYEDIKSRVSNLWLLGLGFAPNCVAEEVFVYCLLKDAFELGWRRINEHIEHWPETEKDKDYGRVQRLMGGDEIGYLFRSDPDAKQAVVVKPCKVHAIPQFIMITLMTVWW